MQNFKMDVMAKKKSESERFAHIVEMLIGVVRRGIEIKVGLMVA